MTGIRIVRICAKLLLIAVLFLTCLFLYPASPVAALSVSDYFTIDYNIILSKYQINDTETFSAVASGSAVCINKLPVTITSATITSRIIARNTATGSEITLNQGFSVKIEPFPNEIGATTQMTREVPLEFPDGSPSGMYSIIGELVQAKVLAIITIDVTGYLPQSSEVGTVHFTATESPSYTTGTTEAIITTLSTAATTTPATVTGEKNAGVSSQTTQTTPTETVDTGNSISAVITTVVNEQSGSMRMNYWWLAAVFLGAAAAGIGAGLLVRHIKSCNKKPEIKY